MKKRNTLIILKLGTLGLVAFFNATSFAQIYTTIASGVWNNTTTVWSTDGGATACLCAPGYILTNTDLVINHTSILSTDLVAGANTNIDINPSGTMTGVAFNVLIANGGVIESFGPVNVLSIIIELGGDGIFHDVVTCVDKFRVEGHAQIDTLVTVTGGDIEIKETGVMDIYVPYIETDVPNGEFKVDGILNLTNTCLYILNGNFRNKVTGTITGAQYIEVQNGDIRNEGVWPTTVDWCASGEALTMPFAPDCNGCLTILLPIDLISFYGTAGTDKNMLYWSTTTEINNDSFTILKSTDRINFEPIGSVQGAGNSTQILNYSISDERLLQETNYYRLQQTDFNGGATFSSIISVTNSANELNSIIVRPNPAHHFIHLGLIEAENIFQVEITNQMGEIIFRTENKSIIDISHLSNGFYFVKISDNIKSVVRKFIKE